MKKTITFLLVLAIMLVLFAGCNRGGSSEAAPDGSTKKLVIWSYMNEGEPIGGWHQQVTDRFEQMYPGVDVELVLCGREILTQFATKLQDRNASDFPDLVSQGTGAMEPLTLDGLFIPLDDYLATERNYEGTKTWGDTFIPNLMDTIKVNGKSYYIPEGLYTHGFFYDENMFAKYNLSVPNTWDELLDVCAALKANGVFPITLDGTTDVYNSWWFIRFATRLVGVEKMNQAARGEISWKSDPAFLQAARYVAVFSQRNYFQDGFAGSVFPAAQALLTRGSAGLLFCGAWIPTEMASQTPPEMKMQMFALPEIPNSVSPRHEEVWSNCFAVTVDGKNKQNAINWLKIYSSEDFQQRKIEIKNPSVLVDGPVVPELREIANIVGNATSTSGSYGGFQVYGAWFTGVMYPISTQLITGSISPEQFIDRLDADTASYWAK